MLADPADIPVKTPVVALIVATDEPDTDHVPGVALSIRVSDAPAQTAALWVMAAGKALTVSVAVETQPAGVE